MKNLIVEERIFGRASVSHRKALYTIDMINVLFEMRTVIKPALDFPDDDG